MFVFIYWQKATIIPLPLFLKFLRSSNLVRNFEKVVIKTYFGGGVLSCKNNLVNLGILYCQFIGKRRYLFHKLKNKFSTYWAYDQTRALLGKLVSTNSEFVKFCEFQRQRCKCEPLGKNYIIIFFWSCVKLIINEPFFFFLWASLLVCPIQRPSRYNLLIREIVRIFDIISTSYRKFYAPSVFDLIPFSKLLTKK